MVCPLPVGCEAQPFERKKTSSVIVLSKYMEKQGSILFRLITNSWYRRTLENIITFYLRKTTIGSLRALSNLLIPLESEATETALMFGVRKI